MKVVPVLQIVLPVIGHERGLRAERISEAPLGHLGSVGAHGASVRVRCAAIAAMLGKIGGGPSLSSAARRRALPTRHRDDRIPPLYRGCPGAGTTRVPAR